jgi:hypothetical protein
MHRLLIAAALAFGFAATPALSNDARREAMIASILPAQDRDGIYLVFPTEAGGFNSVFEVIYFPDQVAEPEVQARIARICAAHKGAGVDGRLYVWRASKAHNVKLSDGSKRAGMRTVLSCFSR